MKLTDQNCLFLRNKTYYFRRKIPLDLLDLYAPQKEVKKSLGTSDHKIATEKVRALLASTDHEFNLKRQLRDAVPTVSITHGEAENLARAWYSIALSEDNTYRKATSWEDRIGNRLALGDITEDYDATLKAMNSNGLQAPRLDWMESFLGDHGIKVLYGTDVYNTLALSFLQAWIDAYEAVIKRDAGRTVLTPPSPAINSPAHKPEIDTFDALRDYWYKTKEPSHRALQKANTIIKKLITYAGDITPSQVNRRTVVGLMESLQEKGLSNSSINTEINILATLFSTALKGERIPSNPCAEIPRLAEKKTKGGRTYTVEELQSIFTSPVFSEGYRPTQGKGEAAFWLPLLALFSGARRGELAQIYTADIGTEDSIPYMIYEVDEETGRTTKTKERRRVVIHPELIKMGFMDYVESIKKAGHTQLFPLLKVSRTGGNLGDKWGAWWSDYLRNTIGNTRIPQPMHGFRHTFIQRARRCEVSREHLTQIVGHTDSKSDVHDTYGDEFAELIPMNKAMHKIHYEGLDLSHLYR